MRTSSRGSPCRVAHHRRLAMRRVGWLFGHHRQSRAGRRRGPLVRNGGTAILSETPEIYGAEHLLTRRAVSLDVGESSSRASSGGRSTPPARRAR